MLNPLRPAAGRYSVCFLMSAPSLNLKSLCLQPEMLFSCWQPYVNATPDVQRICLRSLQGHMVATGTYAELQQSGLDFTSLLKKEEEEEEPQTPQDVLTRSRTLSQNSALSRTSSVHSVKDGDHLPVRTLRRVTSRHPERVQNLRLWPHFFA